MFGAKFGWTFWPFLPRNPTFSCAVPSIVRNCSRERSLEHCHSHAFFVPNFWKGLERTGQKPSWTCFASHLFPRLQGLNYSRCDACGLGSASASSNYGSGYVRIRTWSCWPGPVERGSEGDLAWEAFLSLLHTQFGGLASSRGGLMLKLPGSSCNSWATLERT